MREREAAAQAETQEAQAGGREEPFPHEGSSLVEPEPTEFGLSPTLEVSSLNCVKP